MFSCTDAYISAYLRGSEIRRRYNFDDLGQDLLIHACAKAVNVYSYLIPELLD